MNYFEPEGLLKKAPPTRRAAYSDRTAWLMAEMAGLAYIRFESQQLNLLEVALKLENMNAGEIQQYLAKEVLPAADRTDGKEAIKKPLITSGFDLVKTFSNGGTQAFLAKRETDKLAVLAFRGTEATQLADIKADLNALITNKNGSRIHTGFLNAFKYIQDSIESELEEFGDEYALYITGHSLGGALAIIATKSLNRDNLAACYTYGSPRVGSSEFGDAIKTPIYRIVNTADIVPRMPPGLVIELLVDLLRFIKFIFPFSEIVASWLDNKVSGYRHHGDMRYLTHCKAPDCSDVRLIANISFLARCRRLFKNRISLDKNVTHHGINKYREKLAAYAQKRAG
uniref:Lipase (Class 3) n=1 Tax=Candidatus Kentrum eta TaxID=2126337 RepID=A0A450V9T3_9GAMM|nr:MAG: Lipase (class 3) [Candidatus Kentron sp. H]VFK01548.1 MAG: Lipase (class 3) [Candidatus Kentron sp. H]VFK02420.1 MAG: Lipase (class 3) [Candidatus Kentron sp. H]